MGVLRIVQMRLRKKTVNDHIIIWKLYLNCEVFHYVNVTTVYLCIINDDKLLFMKSNYRNMTPLPNGHIAPPTSILQYHIVQ